MVHALEIVHTLLQPDGALIDIHPSGDPPPVVVRDGARHTVAGWVGESDDFAEYAQADAALAAAVERGLFALERQGVFTFVTHTDSLAGLREYFASEWSDATLDEDTAQRIEALLASAGGDREVILRESVRIARLRAVGP
jgi:hypothetical protein